ncbi:MerR family DNA-binding transcriptional regulator [Nocardia rosealba]|uniref:MerR family DNA-binding transcriptional regulator n=1 Tax=Nocardia rosealba TaxID=2878563 RepID=UPI001CD97C83|nr:MerR family DNA-binding transcriptional regulator [Nocardia rosealba]MCA2208082.1 MerR family DNA-binding transcriptional regulator [Nocardia rosealba]
MRNLRPSDLAQEHGISTQAVRNYEQDGCLPPADRTPAGYRVYTELHAAALRTYLTLISAFGHATASRIMRALHDDRLDTALTEIDRAHARLLEDRETLASVRRAVDHLTSESSFSTVDSEAAYTIGELAGHLRLTPATLRAWEAAGILLPVRDSATGYRMYTSTDRRDAHLAAILRRGFYRLEHIAVVIAQIRGAGSTEGLIAALSGWEGKLTEQGLAMLDAGAVFHGYVGELGV